MFLHPSGYLLLLISTAGIYWLVPASQPKTRALILIVFSLVAIGLFSPQLAGLVVLATLAASAYRRVHAASASRWLLAAFIMVQLAIMLAPDITHLSEPKAFLVTIGITFFTMRNIGYVIDLHKNKTQAGFLDLLFLNSFFPTYSAGPVENTKTFNVDTCRAGFDLSNLLMGVCRILLGILKFYYISDILLEGFLTQHFPTEAKQIAKLNFDDIYIFVVLKWITLYVAFSGYADIAIGSAKIFGLHVRENFRLPFLARNIQDFWQRWNISVMKFVSEYIYLNFVRYTGYRITGLLIVFLAIGFWHEVSLNYLAWGILHAGAMSTYVLYRRSESARHLDGWMRAQPAARFVAIGAGWLVTLTFISTVSAIGNAGSVKEAVAIVKAFVT